MNYLAFLLAILQVYKDSFEIAESLNHSHMVSRPGNITLTYDLPVDWAVQQIKWEKIQPHQIDLLVRCNLSEGISYSRYRKQILTNCTQGIRSNFIIITNATASDSGLYRCHFTARTGENKTFLMNLTITDEKNLLDRGHPKDSVQPDNCTIANQSIISPRLNVFWTEEENGKSEFTCY
ncbi:CD226 antigen [Fukomys damarensis]|uniref:CD226 antigen n=1 Tax=Fukomys damarensis TaxID=885580 RepID=A0A091E6L8_FUKDA|nr:CD226 antigen [Fukomys damarensis]